MLAPIFFDAVTLRHFGAIEQLEVLRACTHGRPLPHWTEAVRDEISAGHRHPECVAVLAAAWLGPPQQPVVAEFAEIYRIQVGLNDGWRPTTEHRGEAESMYFADSFHGIFVTDDNAAYDFASRRLGPERVWDTVEILRHNVAVRGLLSSDALLMANAIRNAGRNLRRVHPSTLLEGYFG